MRKKKLINSLWYSLPGLIIIVVLVYWFPPVHSRLAWRMDLAQTYWHGVINPVKPLPTSLPQPTKTLGVTTTPTPTPTPPTPTATAVLSPTPLPPTLTPTPIPPSVALPPPQWEEQGPNNCGPATLVMYLRHYGWGGTEDDIANVLKPNSEDRNVNVEELVYYVRTHAGWLNAEFRVGGDLTRLKTLIAAGYPVMVEESFHFNETYWPNDDKWAAHYLLVTGYDDAAKIFIGQDSFHGPDQKIPYATLDSYWQIFNRVYILVYPPEQQDTIKSLLGSDWEVDVNRQHALDTARAETTTDSKNAFAWFNIGTNLVYFGQYADAASAYDTARDLGLPQRMLRYQFGPFFAYFHATRNDDLIALTEYALQRTPNSEEALLWHGWALYQRGKPGDRVAAIGEFQKALAAHPGYEDALYAIDYVQKN